MPTLSSSDQLANRRKQQLKYDDIVAANTARSIRLGVVNAPRSNSAEVNSRRTARELDAPTQVVQALPDRAEQELKVRRRVNAARQAPRLAGVLSDPYTTTFAEDDLEEMVRLSTTAQKSGSFQDISRAYSAGRFNLGQPSALAPRKTLKEEYVDDALVEGGFFNLEKSLVGLTLAGAEKLNSLRTFFGLSELENIKELRKGAFLAGDVLDKEVAKRVDGDNAAQRGIKQGLASIQTSAFSLAIGRGRPVFTASTAGTLTGGSSYLTARSQGLDEDSALTYAAIDGTIEALTEVGPLKALLDRTPVGSTLGKRISNYLAREQIGEQVATAGQDFNAWVFLPENKDKTFGDYLAERPEAAVETFFAALTSSAVQGGTVGAVQRVADIAIRRASRAQSSLEDAQAIDNIMDSAAKHKMREADPQAFEEYVASQTQGTPAENIYIPTEAVDTYLQSEYATELAERAPEVLEAINEQLEEARAVNGDIVIPTSRAATLLAGTQFWEAIKADARIDAGGLSPRELENSGDEVQRTFEELGGKIYAQAVEQLNTDSATQQVFEEVRAQLSEIGFSNKAAEEQATLYAANRAAMGARFGLDAVQYHEANPVEFRRAGINDAQSGEGKVFNQPQGSETGQEVQSAPTPDGEPQTTTAGSTAPTDIGDTALPEITKEQIDKAASDVASEEVTPIVQLRQTSPTNEPTPQILEVSEIRDKAAKVANNVPGFSSMLPYLSDEELQGLRKQSAEKMMRIFSELPSADETASVAFSGRAKRGWYERSAQTLVDIFGAKDATRFAALLAALSPQTSVEANAINALNVWVNWDARKRPTDRQAILNIMADSVQGDKGLGSVLTAWIDNSMRALQTQDVTGLKLSGPKVNSFWLNLVGVVDEVTNDTWMANYSLMEAQLLQGVKKQGLLDKGPGYKALSAATRRAAEILSNRTGDTWTPAEVQETVWSWVKTLTEKRAGTGAVTAQDILAAGGLTQEDIGNTPDFAQLFTRGVYRRILETGGYSAEIFALESSGQAAPPPNPEGQVTDAEGSGVDSDTFQRHLNAAAARVDFRYVERYGPPSVDNQLDMFSIDHVANRFSPANISNLLKHDDWAVLTAENPNGQQATDKANARAMRNLRADMTAMGLEFKEAIGKYGQIENSFVVVGITRAEADRLGRKYGQDSVLTRDGFLYQDGTMNPVSDGVQTFDERPEDFFTEIPSLGTKFAIGIDFDTRVKADSADTVRVLNQAAADGEIISDHQYRRVKANSTLVDIRQADDGTLLWVAERGSINLGHIPRELESNGYPGEAVLPDDPRLENSTPVLIKTPPVIDGKITLQHFSGVAGLDTLDPTRWGSNAKFLPKSERERLSSAPPRTYFGIETGKAGGYVNEFSGDSVVEYTAQVDADRLYDIGSDPENLREGTSGGGFEQAVLDAGYIGYWHQNNYLGLVAVVFEPTQVSQVSDVNTQSPDAPTLGGLPKVSPGRFKTARTAAAEYAKNAGIEYRGLDEYAPLDTDRAARIADEYERMEHKPNDPEVRAAYNAMVEETLAQWQEIKKTGLTAEFVTGDDPYGGSPWGAIRDVRDNNHMWVFSTEDGYGQGGITAEMEAENPMLALVPDENFGGKPVRVNDIFRVVHDYFGHVKEGFGFRARGEENAWRSHSLMFSPLARRALTTETRGQNSWLNYGPHGETNRTASVEDTVFAEQKIGLMAEWTSDIEAQSDPIIFNQKNKPTVRGQVAFYPDRKVITLFEDADMSTLLHETGHIFVEELAKNATAKGAPKDVKADWAAVKSWLKKNGHTVRGSNIPREAHELLARGFERYLMEGKAPSSQLESAFATFRGWLINIYRNVLKLRSPITPEIRDVFGRMLATDQAIEEYTNEQSAQPLIKDKPDGMTEAEFNSFRDSALAARDNAQAQLIKKVTEQLRKSKNAARRDAMQSAKDEAEETVNAEPRFIALHLLRTGRWLSGEGNNPGNTKLNYEWVVQRYGEDALNKLPNGKIVKKDGEDAEYIAELTGFNSADDMMQALFDMKEQQDRMTADGDRRQLRDRMIDETAQEILGENPATSDIDLEEEAIAAVQNEKQGELITKEARYLARGTGQTPTPYRLARAWAARKIQSGLVQEVASKAAVYRYSRAAAKSAKLAEEAYIVDDFAGAYRHKQAQIINHALFMEARIAKDRVVTIERRMKRLAKRKAMKSVDQDYMDKIHVMLEAFDFRPRTNKFLEQQEEFHRWAAEQAAQGFEVNVPPKLVTQGTHYTRATLETLYGFDDTVQSLLELGRLRQNIVDAEEERKLGEYIDEAVANIAELPAKISDTSINPDNRVVASAMAPLLKIETMADDLDNGNSNGPFNRLLVHRASDAENVRAALRERTLKPIAEAYLGMPAQHRKRLEEKITISEFPHRGGELDPRNGDPVIMTRMELLSVALNSGNMSNLEKMAKGEGWEISDIQSVLNRELQKEDWDFVQTVWDSLQSMWPDIAATERRLSGVVPEQVDVLPVETPFGTYRGGYYPVVYDPDRAQFAENNAANEANDLFGMASGIATPKGHTITRTGAVGPIYRSVEGVLFNHVEKVITRVAYAEYARDVLRVVNNSRVRNALDLKFGKEYRRQIRPWLQRSINAGSVDTRGLAWWERMMRSVRINTTLVAMGFRVSTGLAQVAGLTASAARIGPVKVAQGIRQLLIERGDAVEFVMSRSPEMARRNNEVNRDIADAFKQLRGKNGPVDRARAMAFWHIGMIDRYIVAVPTWLGAHSQGIEQGMTDEQASRYADKSVRQSQGSGQEKDLANWQSPTGETMRWLTLFYTYFNVQLNSQWEAVRNTKKGQYQKAAQLSFWFMMAAPLVDALISGDLPDEKDDPEAWANWFARNVFFGLFSGIPVARDVAAYGERKMSGQYATLGSTPLLRTLDVGERAAVLASKAATGEELPDNTVKIMVETPGYFLGLPTGQASGTSQFLWDYSNGEVDPKTFNDWYWGLSKGKIPEEKK